MKTKYRILGFIVITKVEYGRSEDWFNSLNLEPHVDWKLWGILIYRQYTQVRLE